MSDNVGTQLSAPIIQKGVNDPFPTHYPNRGFGGTRTNYADLSSLTSIPEAQREQYMRIWTNDGRLYVLAADLVTWVDVTPTPGSAPSFTPIETFGATGDGQTPDSQAFAAAAYSGYAVSLTPGKSYRIDQSVDCQNTSLLGLGGKILVDDGVTFGACEVLNLIDIFDIRSGQTGTGIVLLHSRRYCLNWFVTPGGLLLLYNSLLPPAVTSAELVTNALDAPNSILNSSAYLSDGKAVRNLGINGRRAVGFHSWAWPTLNNNATAAFLKQQLFVEDSVISAALIDSGIGSACIATVHANYSLRGQVANLNVILTNRLGFALSPADGNFYTKTLSAAYLRQTYLPGVLPSTIAAGAVVTGTLPMTGLKAGDHIVLDYVLARQAPVNDFAAGALISELNVPFAVHIQGWCAADGTLSFAIYNPGAAAAVGATISLVLGAATPAGFQVGDTITDATSGATGKLAYTDTNFLHELFLTNVTGSFAAGDNATDGATSAAISNIYNNVVCAYAAVLNKSKADATVVLPYAGGSLAPGASVNLLARSSPAPSGVGPSFSHAAPSFDLQGCFLIKQGSNSVTIFNPTAASVTLAAGQIEILTYVDALIDA